MAQVCGDNDCVICYEPFDLNDPFDVATCDNGHKIHVACYEKLSKDKKKCVVCRVGNYSMKNPKDEVIKMLLEVASKHLQNSLNIKLMTYWVKSESSAEKGVQMIRESKCINSGFFKELVAAGKLKEAQAIVDNGLDLQHPGFDASSFINKLLNTKTAFFSIKFLLDNKITIFKNDFLKNINSNIFETNIEALTALSDYCSATNQPIDLYTDKSLAYIGLSKNKFEFVKSCLLQYSTTKQYNDNKNLLFSMSTWKNNGKIYEVLLSNYKYSQEELCLAFEMAVRENTINMVEYMWAHRETIALDICGCHNLVLWALQHNNYRFTHKLLSSKEYDISNENLDDLCAQLEELLDSSEVTKQCGNCKRKMSMVVIRCNYCGGNVFVPNSDSDSSSDED